MPAVAGWQQHCRKHRLFQETAWEKDILLFLEMPGLSRLSHKAGWAVGISSIQNDPHSPCQTQQPPSRDCCQMSHKYLRFTRGQRGHRAGWLINTNIHPFRQPTHTFPRSNPVLMSTHASPLMFTKKKFSFKSVRNTINAIAWTMNSHPESFKAIPQHRSYTGIPTGWRSTEQRWAPFFNLTSWALLFLSSKEWFSKNTGPQSHIVCG